MRRRELLAAAATVGGVSGCTELFNDEFPTYSLNEYSFAGVAVVASGTSQEYQPFTITTKVRSDGEIVVKRETTVQDASDEVVHTIYEGLSPHSKYVITVATPDDKREKATDELRRDTQERIAGVDTDFIDERVGYVFRCMYPDTFSFEPRVVSDDWPESGVDPLPYWPPSGVDPLPYS